MNNYSLSRLMISFTPKNILNIPLRNFAHASRNIGPNDQIKIAKLRNKYVEDKKKIRGFPFYSLSGLTRQLPPGSYRGSYQAKQLEGYNELVRRALSVHTAGAGQLRQARVKHLITMFGKHKYDVSSPAIQSAVLCQRVMSLVVHLKQNRNDNKSVRALKTCLAKRQRSLQYLKQHHYCDFVQVMRYYGIPDKNLAMVKKNFWHRRWKPM